MNETPATPLHALCPGCGRMTCEHFAASQPGAPPSPESGMRRYQIVVEIPDPRAADELVHGQVTEVTR